MSYMFFVYYKIMKLCIPQDYYVFSYEQPRLDISQDWVLLNATEDVGYTVLEFMRDFQTCDLQDDNTITFVSVYYL